MQKWTSQPEDARKIGPFSCIGVQQHRLYSLPRQGRRRRTVPIRLSMVCRFEASTYGATARATARAGTGTRAGAGGPREGLGRGNGGAYGGAE